MSGGGGSRGDYGSGGFYGGGQNSRDNCKSLRIETVLNSPDPKVVPPLKKGDVLTVDLADRGNTKILVAKMEDGSIAGSLTPPSLPAIMSCIEKGYDFEATVLETSPVIRLRIESKK